MRDYTAAIGLPGITRSMVDLAMSGQIKGLAGNTMTRDEMAAVMVVEKALGY